MVSGTLNRTTDAIAEVRRRLGNRFAGIFDRTPPHTPWGAVIEAAAAARDAGADLIATIGGGSVTRRMTSENAPPCRGCLCCSLQRIYSERLCLGPLAVLDCHYPASRMTEILMQSNAEV